jgi:hypothetical protein
MKNTPWPLRVNIEDSNIYKKKILNLMKYLKRLNKKKGNGIWRDGLGSWKTLDKYDVCMCLSAHVCACVQYTYLIFLLSFIWKHFQQPYFLLYYAHEQFQSCASV